jgi:1-deoxy-D-xylulose-5-phosphate synthase
MEMRRILDIVNKPSDLKELSIEELDQLAAEVRSLIIDTVSKNGGHLAANLGVVELTIALLKTFQPPDDKIVWDVSHQTYAYKILTGRRDRFNTLRQFGGIAGFLRREESEYDVFGAGHAGTSISAALGMAVARDRRGSSENVVAVLGDGSVGCGISFEAFNNVHNTTKRLIVILNDNEMSISANVGAMAGYLGGLLTNPRYNRWKKSVESMAERMGLGWLRKTYYRIEEAIKGLFLKSVLFEEFGLRYIGPIDGHNIRALLDALAIARDAVKPIIVHVSTQKGKGYSFAEQYPEKWHGAVRFDIDSGEPLSKHDSPTYSAVFGTVLERMAVDNPKIVAITAAMSAGTGLAAFSRRFPDRFFDVGISEEHAVVFAAGLATQGLLPVFAVYSTFLQRTIDCIIHDVCLQNLPVVFCIDRAGIVGDDGPTHHGVFDIALLRPVPGLVIMQPKDENELANMLHTALKLGKPVAMRYPRAIASRMPVPENFVDLEIGKAETVEPGSSVQIWALGDMVPIAERASEILKERGVDAGVVNARFVRPLDEALLNEQSAGARLFATIENGVVAGGFGTAVEEFLVLRGFKGTILRFGWPDQFIPHGPPAVLMEKYGLTSNAIADSIMKSMTAPQTA